MIKEVELLANISKALSVYYIKLSGFLDLSMVKLIWDTACLNNLRFTISVA